MARYVLRPVGDELAYIRQEDAPMPVRAQGFLRFEHPAREQLICEVRDGKIMLWVQERPSPKIPRQSPHQTKI